MPTTPTAPTAVPDFPELSDRATYNARAYAWAVHMDDVYPAEMLALANNTYSNSMEAEADATTATTQAGIATAQAVAAAASAAAASITAGAAAWVNGATYALNENAISGLDFQTYRKKTASSVTTTDPSADPTNWVFLGASGLPVTVVSTTSQAAVAGSHYILTNVAESTVTLPASPASGNTVWVTVDNSLTTNVIARNGETIMGVAEDMTIDNQNATVELRFVSNSWRLV